MQKRGKWREQSLVRPRLGHSSTPGPTLRALSLVRDPPSTQGSHRGANGLMVPWTPQAFQVARDLPSLLVPPTPVGDLPAPLSGSRREQGASGTLLALGPPAPSRSKPYLIPASLSLVCHWSPDSQHHMEAEVGTTPPLLPREESSSESKGNLMYRQKPTICTQPTLHHASVGTSKLKLVQNNGSLIIKCSFMLIACSSTATS